MRADPVDTLGMLEATLALPEQMERACEAARHATGLPDHDSIENVVVLGMGGSGIAGDFVASVAGPFMPVPVVVQKGYAPPQFVDEHSLVFAISFSGDTEETVEAASMAAIDGARLVVVAGGGELASQAKSWSAATIEVDTSIPMPRAALGALAIPPLLVLEQVGLFPGASGWVDLAIEQLRARRDLLASGGDAARLARKMAGHLPVVYGGGSLGEVAALRWKNQLNENSKVPAFSNAIPELTHNEICGWAEPNPMRPDLFHVVCLRSDHEHPQIARRFELVNEIVDGTVAGVDEVLAEGEGPLAQLLDLVLFGDVTSIHLAYELGVDPGPVPVLEQMKRRLAQR